MNYAIDFEKLLSVNLLDLSDIPTSDIECDTVYETV